MRISSVRSNILKREDIPNVVKPVYKEGIIQVAPAEEGGGASSEQIKDFARKEGMSETKAATVLQQYTQNKAAPQFQNLGTQQRINLEIATQRVQSAPPSNTVKVGTKTGSPEYVPQSTLERIQKELGSYAASVLKDKGTKAFNQLQKQYVEGENARLKAQQAKGEPAVSTKSAEADKYQGWTAEELMHGKVEKGVYTLSPYGVHGKTYIPYPEFAEKKIVEAINKAVKELKPYLYAVLQLVPV